MASSRSSDCTTRGVAVAAALVTSLSAISLPLHRRTRQLVRDLQTLLRTLAEDQQSCLDESGEAFLAQQRPTSRTIALAHPVRSLATPADQRTCRIAGRRRHLAPPASKFRTGADAGPRATTFRPDATDSLQDVYYTAVLLGCAQPASFTSLETGFIVACLGRFAGLVEPVDDPDPADGAVFSWIDPERDAPAVARSRKAVPPQTPVRCFSARRIKDLLGA